MWKSDTMENNREKKKKNRNKTHKKADKYVRSSWFYPGSFYLHDRGVHSGRSRIPYQQNLNFILMYIYVYFSRKLQVKICIRWNDRSLFKINVLFPSFWCASLDIDECKNPELAAKCVENAECCNLPAHYSCKCKPGFQGDGEKQCLGKPHCRTSFFFSYWIQR